MTDEIRKLREYVKAERESAQTRLKTEMTSGLKKKSQLAKDIRSYVHKLGEIQYECSRMWSTLDHFEKQATASGRKYAYLLKAIKHELGEHSLAGFLAEANRLMEADAASAEVEGYA